MTLPKTWETSCPNIAKALALLSSHENETYSPDETKRTIAAAWTELAAAFDDKSRGLSPGEAQAIMQLVTFGTGGLLALRTEQAEREKNPKLQALSVASKRRADELETLLRRVNTIAEQWKTTT